MGMFWWRGGAAVLLALAVAFLPARAAAQQTMERVYYGFNLNAAVGMVIPGTDEFGNSLYIRGGAGYEVNENLGFGFSVGRFSSDVDHDMATPPVNTIADGELKVIPVTATAEFRHFVPQIYGTLYGLAGIGYYFVDYSWSSSAEGYFREVEQLYGPPQQDVSDSFGFHLGGGFEYPLTSQFSLGGEAQYLFLKPDAEGMWRDLVTGEPHSFDDSIDLDSWILSFGFKFIF
jgi:outer membrane protein W